MNDSEGSVAREEEYLADAGYDPDYPHAGTPVDRRPFLPADPERYDTVGTVTIPKTLGKGHRRAMFPNEVKPEATVILDSTGAWLKTPKDDGFLEALKALVPWSDRQWVPAETSWFVTTGYAHNATELVKLFWQRVEVKDLRND